ncbi:MAG: M81 family metallopeptidase, partial [Chitinophagaceae bacterium]
MSLKIALLGIYHESNTFVQTFTLLSDFQKGHYLKGHAIRREYMEAHHEIGGMIEILD